MAYLPTEAVDLCNLDASARCRQHLESAHAYDTHRHQAQCTKAEGHGSTPSACVDQAGGRGLWGGNQALVAAACSPTLLPGRRDETMARYIGRSS